jgi:COP9 signalosome complex subunit 3
MAPTDTSVSLDNIINQITTANNAAVLNHTLRNAIPKESRETIFSSALAGGQDPLAVLDMRQNTLGVLYIMQVSVYVS